MSEVEKGKSKNASEQSKLTDSLLDLGYNKYNSSSSSDSKNERFDCREDLPFWFENVDTGEKAPYRCNEWDCYCCGYRMRQNLVEGIEELVNEKPSMRRLMTLTLDPSKIPDDNKEQSDYIMHVWEKMRVYIERHYGEFSYVWVKEKQDNGNWHLHVLISRYLAWEWINNAWKSLGGGHVRIEKIDRVEKVSRYLGKYLTKNALSGFPKNVRRYGTSENINLNVRNNTESEDNWKLYTTNEFSKEKDKREVDSIDFIKYKEDPQPPPT